MYEQVFGFNDRPFTSTPFVKHYFAAKAIEQSCSQIRSCIDRASGPVIVIGNPGTGKTLLLNVIAGEYQDKFNVVNLTCARLDQRSDLLQSILFELRQPYKEMSEGELRLALIDFLKPSDRCPNGVLLLVDDAHSLSLGLLDEVRLITNLIRDGLPRVRLVLAGNQRLEENLTDPKLESFNQRVAARNYLENLSYEETRSYITTHIARASGQAESLFEEEALHAVYELTDGCPRLVNQVCEQSLVLAATRGTPVIQETAVREAWNDLQNIPGSWTPTPNHAPATTAMQDEEWTVLEFGSLGEENPPQDQPDDQSEYQLDAQTDYLTSDQTGQTPGERTELESDVYQITDIEDAGSGPQFVEPEDVETAQDSDSLAQFETREPVSESPVSEEPVSSEDVYPETPVEIQNTSGQVASVENPFDEEYEEEEFLIDKYLPFVAEQNRNSLNVTASQLETLRPPQMSITLEELQADLLGEESGEPPIESNESRDTDYDQPTETQAQVEPASSVVAPYVEDGEESSQSGFDIVHNYDEFVEQCNTIDDSDGYIQRRAEQIIENLALNQDVLLDEGNIDNLVDQPTSEVDEGASNPSGPILNEIESQQRMVDSVLNRALSEPDGDSEVHEPEASLAIEYPVTQHQEYNREPEECELPDDDRDMIIVSRADHLTRTPSEEDDSEEQSDESPSTGRATRMDYQQLFEKLRQLPSDE